MIIGGKPEAKRAKMKVILFHGYGSCGANMHHLAHTLAMPGATFLCPDGPEVCQEYPEGRQWFSLKGMDWETPNLQRAWRGIQGPLSHAAKNFHTEFKAQWDDFSGPIVVAGFSQGAMMAYELGLFGPKVLAAIGFSGAYFLNQSPVNRPMLFWTHAQDDTVVPLQWAEQGGGIFVEQGLAAQHHVDKQGGHSISENAVLATRRFLQKILQEADEIDRSQGGQRKI
jgi:phospholipase/carboxylesterase